jgi:hypothetical protein
MAFSPRHPAGFRFILTGGRFDSKESTPNLNRGETALKLYMEAYHDSTQRLTPDKPECHFSDGEGLVEHRTKSP